MKLHDSLHPEIMVSVIVFDHVCDMLAALHPGLDELGKHLEDSLARASAMSFENWQGNATELKLKVVPEE